MPSPKLPDILRMGTRGSQLALAQSGLILAQLQARFPKTKFERVVIETSGDTFKGERLADAGGKALFVKEIEEALLQGSIDFAVHSLKDLPGFLPTDLMLACYPKREVANDCFISRQNLMLKEMPAGSKIGTSSPRRAAQVLSFRPDCVVLPLRGNVDTRLKKLGQDHYDAILLAAAGLRRLGRGDVPHHLLPTDQFIPAVGQGVLGIETRKTETLLIETLREVLEDEETAIAARAERSFLAAVGGDCHSPIAAHAIVANGELLIACWIGSMDGKRSVRLQKRSELSNAEALGESLAKEALSKGGREILDEITADQKR